MHSEEVTMTNRMAFTARSFLLRLALAVAMIFCANWSATTSIWPACVAARLRSLSATALNGSSSRWSEIADFACWSLGWRWADIV